MSANLIYRYDAKKEQEEIADIHGFQSRNYSLIQLLKMATYFSGGFENSFEVPVYTTDGPPESENKTYLSFCDNEIPDDNRIVIPDYTFHSWPEASLPAYPDLVRDMIESSRTPPIHHKLFWIGSVGTHWTRGKMLNDFSNNPKFDVRNFDWDHPENRVSISDHCQYKFLIDLQGCGYSGRLKMLLFSGRTLFVQKRFVADWAYSIIQPMVHYIPVNDDLSDLGEKVDWAFSNLEESEKIAQQAQKFAMRHLTQTSAIIKLTSCLRQVSEKQVLNVVV